MIDKQSIIDLTKQWIENKKNYFLVDVDVTKDNRVVVDIDQSEGVWIDDCVELSRFLESNLSRDVEDYELEVGSAGIGQPFKVVQQDINHVGKEVEVLTAEGKKEHGILKSVDGNDFVVTVKEKIKKEGAKRPTLVDVDKPFKMDNIKYTKYLISFK